MTPETKASDLEGLKKRVEEAIDKRRDQIIAIGRRIFAHPELGYKERKTAALVEETMQSLGIEPRTEIALTGLRADLEGSEPGPTVAVLGELDAVLCPGHPHAHPETGASHSCGHNGQVASMLGVAMGLLDGGALKHLSGRVSLMAVPAEEYVEIEYRQRLRRDGKIRFLGGKQEFLRLGEFDDVDMVMMVHMGSEYEGKLASIGGTSNGFIGKFITYRGREAHAGGAPHQGINALNAAMLGLMGIHAQRETFRDADHIRVHPIITKGGNLVNIIPSEVTMETYVRGATMEAITDASARVNRALEAGAHAIGAEVEIEEIPGYLPRLSAQEIGEIFRDNLTNWIDEDKIAWGGHGAGSTDLGDISHIMPAIHPMIGGAAGAGHSADFEIIDEDLAYIIPAKAMALTIVDLLGVGAARAREVIEGFEPQYDKESYLKMWDTVLQTDGADRLSRQTEGPA